MGGRRDETRSLQRQKGERMRQDERRRRRRLCIVVISPFDGADGGARTLVCCFRRPGPAGFLYDGERFVRGLRTAQLAWPHDRPSSHRHDQTQSQPSQSRSRHAALGTREKGPRSGVPSHGAWTEDAMRRWLARRRTRRKEKQCGPPSLPRQKRKNGKACAFNHKITPCSPHPLPDACAILYPPPPSTQPPTRRRRRWDRLRVDVTAAEQSLPDAEPSAQPLAPSLLAETDGDGVETTTTPASTLGSRALFASTIPFQRHNHSGAKRWRFENGG